MYDFRNSKLRYYKTNLKTDTDNDMQTTTSSF